MNIIGIIAEYNPFHNGHLYQINKIKSELNPDLLVAITSGNYTQRGEISSIDKFNKARICIENGINLCVELPLIYSIQSADYFAYYSVYILNMLNVNMIVAGSEINDTEFLIKLADEMNSKKYNELIKKYLDLGLSYKMSSNNALKDLGYDNLGPNDTLNISYINAIKKINPNIKFETIKRTIDYNSINPINDIASASYIRNNSPYGYVPNNTLEYFKKYGFNSLNNYIDIIKYSFLNCDFKDILNMDEGLDGFFKKIPLNDLNLPINTKRYSTSRINRVIISILLNIKKHTLKKPNYIRILSMDDLGKNYISSIKKNLNIYTNIKNNLDPYLDLEIKGSILYSLKSNVNTYKLEFNNPYILNKK